MFRGGKEVVVEVEFDSYQARYTRERSFHPTQERKELGDGRLRVTFETSEAALEQVARMADAIWRARGGSGASEVAGDGAGEIDQSIGILRSTAG